MLLLPPFFFPILPTARYWFSCPTVLILFVCYCDGGCRDCDEMKGIDPGGKCRFLFL